MIWTDLTADKINGLVDAIMCVLGAKYPVYSGDFANADSLLGYVDIDGIDLDVELGDRRLSHEVSDGVA